jgi:hypothetical protein
MCNVDKKKNKKYSEEYQVDDEKDVERNIHKVVSKVKVSSMMYQVLRKELTILYTLYLILDTF